MVEGKIYFIVSDLDSEYHKAIKDLNFQETEMGFARTFPKNTPSLNQIYQSFALHAEEMILQAAGLLRPDWETALTKLLERTTGKNVNWWLTGSTALAIRGIDVWPLDIDLVVRNGDDAKSLGEVLSDWLVEPVQQSEGWVAKWFGRAFKHTRIEWVGDVEAWVDSPEPSDFGPMAARKLEIVNWRGFEILVPPLGLQLRVSERRRLIGRANMIRENMATASR